MSNIKLRTALIGALFSWFALVQYNVEKNNNECSNELTNGLQANIKIVQCHVNEFDLPQHLKDLIVAQAVLESNLAKPSKLAKEHRNLFGIKCKDGAKLKTWEHIGGKDITVYDTFCSFSTLKEGFNKRVDLIGKNKRYSKVMSSKSFNEAAIEIYKAGYATDPNYSKKLISIYNQYLKK